MQKVSSHVYVENSFRGCNTSFVTTSQGVVMIDTPLVPVDAKQWRNVIAEYGEIRYVINSEPHPDHVSGDCWFEGILVACEGARQAIQNITIKELLNLLGQMAPESLPLDSEFRYRLPDITFSQKLILFLGDHTFQLFRLPGHTPNQLAVYVPEEKVVFTSDNVNLEMPVFSSDSMPYAWLDSLKKLHQMDVEKVVPGHGAVCEKNSIQEMYNLLQAWIESVKSAISKGWSVEETLNRVKIYPEQELNSTMKGLKNRSITKLYEILKV